MKKQNKTGTTLKAILAAWIMMVFGTSMFLFIFSAVEQKIYSANAFTNFFRSVWEIADEMGPAVKLSWVIMFALMVFLFKNMGIAKPVFLYLKSMLFASVSTLFVLSFLPADFSRGFGIGFSGSRFDTKTTIIYLVGSVLSGIVFAIVAAKASQNPT